MKIYFRLLNIGFLRENLTGSEDICHGLNPIREDNEILDQPCALRSEWSVAHKYSDLEYMKRIFFKTITTDCSDKFVLF